MDDKYNYRHNYFTASNNNEPSHSTSIEVNGGSKFGSIGSNRQTRRYASQDNLRISWSSLSPRELGSSSSSSPPSYGCDTPPEPYNLNSLANGLLQMSNKTNGSSPGFKTPTSDPGTHYYLDYMDGHCDIYVSKQRKNLSDVAQADQYPSIQSTNSPSQSCNIHKDAIIFYCHSCNHVVCSVCEENVHNEHMTMSVTDAFEVAETQSNQVLNDIKDYVSILQNSIQKVEKSVNDLEYQVESIKGHISGVISRAIFALQEHQRDLYSHIDQVKSEREAILTYKFNYLKMNMHQLLKVTMGLTEAKKYLTVSRDPSALFSLKAKASAVIAKIESDPVLHSQLKECHLSFTAQEENIRKMIKSLGFVNSEPPTFVNHEARALKVRSPYGQVPLILPKTMHEKIQERQEQQWYHQIQLERQRQHQQEARFQSQNAGPAPPGAPISCMGNKKIVVRTGEHTNFPEPKIIFGETENRNDELCRPWGVTCDNEGNIFIADRSNNQIQVFDKGGNFVRKFGTRGTEDGQFDKVAGVAIDERQRVVVADKDNHRIQVLTKEGKFLLKFGEKGSKNGQFNYPWDVATNKKCEIVVSDTRNHRIQLFSADGAFLRKFGSETLQVMWKTLDSPRGVCFTPQGEIVVTDFNNHHILVVDYSFVGAKIITSERSYTSTPFLRLQGVVVDDNGNIIVSDSRNTRIQVLDRNGELKWKFGSLGNQNNKLDRPCGVALTPDGRIVVVDFGNNRVLVY